MPLTYNDLAKTLRAQYPGMYDIDVWTNEDLAKRFINLEPALKDYVSDWEHLYEPTAEDRSGDLSFMYYQFREQMSGIPEWFVGSMAVATNMAGIPISQNLGAWSEEMRAESAEWTRNYLTENPEIAGYLKWIEEEPITLDNWWHLEIFQRSLAQAAPSMVTMIVTDLLLIPITGGVGALVTKAKAGKKFLDVYRGIKGARKVARGIDVAEDVGEFAKLAKTVDRARTAGTMFSMGVYEAAGEYSEAMSYLVDEKGMDPMQAQEIATASAAIVGTINGIIEYMPYGMFKNQLFTSAAKKQANSKIIKRVADSFLKDSKIARGVARIGKGAIQQGLAEGGQEWAQHMVQTLSQFAYKSGYGDTEETAFEEFIKQATSPQAISAAHAGGSMGVLMGPLAVGGQGLIARQRRVLEREDELGVSFVGERPPPLDVEEEGITVEAKLVEEDLSKNELIMRSFTGQNLDNLSLNTQVAMDAIEEEFGSPSDIQTDPEIEANWKGALEDIVTDDPGAFEDIPDRDLALEAIEERLGEDFREVVEEAWTPPAEEAPPVEEVAPEAVVEPTEEVPPVTVIEEEPEPGEVVEREAPKDLFKKKAPAEVTPEDVHKAAEAVGMAWDDDADFMALSKKVTGQERIDDMTSEERASLISEIEKAPAEEEYLWSKKDQEVYLWSKEDQTVYTASKVWKDSMPAATPEQIAKYPVKPLPEEAPAKERQQPIIPPVPITNEEKRVMLVESAEEIQQLQKEGLFYTPPGAKQYFRLGDVRIPDVDKKFSGLGTRFVNAKKKEFLAKGHDHMEIIAQPGSEGFWEKQGFYHTGVTEDYRDPETGELLEPHSKMRLDLPVVSKEAPAEEGEMITLYRAVPVDKENIVIDGNIVSPADNNDARAIMEKFGQRGVWAARKREDAKGQGGKQDKMLKFKVPRKWYEQKAKELGLEGDEQINMFLGGIPAKYLVKDEAPTGLTEEEAEAKLAEYLGPIERVQFPAAKSFDDIHAIVDGKRVELTKIQKEQLNKIREGKDSASKYMRAGAEVAHLKFGRDLIRQQEAPEIVEPKAPVIDDIKEVKGNRFANEKEIDEVQEVDISETREGLADIEGTSDYRNFNNINAKINHALGIRIFKETEKAWHTQQIIGNYANADEAIDATIEEFTTIKDNKGNIITPGIRPEVLTPGIRNALRNNYYRLHNMDRTNQNDPSKNDQVNAEVILPTHGIPRIQIKKEKNSILKKTNPSYATSLSAVTDRDLVWISPRDIYDRKITADILDHSIVETNSRYQPITTNEVLTLHYSEANKGLYAFSFVKGEGKIAFTKINPEHKELAKDVKKLREYWKNEGMSKEDIGNYILDPSLKHTFPNPDGTGDIVLDPVNLSAANVARYEAIKRHYPKFLDDPGGMPNVFKRMKIPMTPTIQLKDFRPVKVKIVNKDNLVYVYPDRVVKATETGIYKGDGGTPTSKQFFKDSAKLWGEGANSRISKNVIYENNELGTLMVKHLMFQPQGNALIYENYGQENEKLIGELRDGDIYAFSKPKAWTKTSLDKYLKDNDLIGADSKRLIDAFTDETADNIGRLTSAVNSVLEVPKFKELSLPSINDQLEFISSKEGLLKQLVRKVASPEEMELIDHLLTSDEAKVTTDSFGEFAKSGETFEVQGESLGFIYSTEGRKDKTPYPDQHHNYVRDEALQQAWSDYYIPKMHEQIRNVFNKSRGKVIDNIASFANHIRNRDTESIDDPTADSFEVGMGLHYSGAQFLDVLMQKKGVIPAVQVANQKGISEKMQSDIQGILDRNEVSPSKKNASTIYESYAKDKGISFKEAKKSASMEDINEWLADENTPDVYLLGFRSPTSYVHGAGMVRVHSIHDSLDVVFMHYLDIKVNYEADGDGDTFNMVALPDELTRLYREYYESDEIRQQLKAINLDDFLPKKPREYKFSSIKDMAALTSALMRGKNAIPEIAKTQRIYGQLLDREFSMKIEGVKIGLRSPGSLQSTDNFKAGSKYTMSDYLRIYLQAAVDNGKYMLLDKWDYSNEKLRRSLFITEDKEDITPTQWKAIKIVVDIHGLNGQIRKGKDSDLGIWGLKTMIEKSGFYLSYTQDREGFIRNKIAERYPELYVSEINFKEGLSNQEAAAVQPAIMYNDMARTGEEGSPFSFNMARHQDAHDVAIQKIQNLKEDIVESDKGLYYGQDMGQDLYDMYDELADAGVEIGFLGWSHNEKMVDFAETYSKRFNALSDNAKKVATFTFLEGVKRLTGKQVHYPLNLPPMSKRKNGISLLDHRVMRSYFKKYNDRLLSPENIRDDVIKANSRHTGFLTFIAKNCL